MLYMFAIMGMATSLLGGVTFPVVPSGEAWAFRFAPKSADYYWDYGARLHIDLIEWDDIRVFGSLLYRSTAGYDATQEVTHFDPIYAFYHQVVGMEYRRWGAIGFISIHRDCLHDIDRKSHLSEFWTTVRLGAGNYNPYRESTWRMNPRMRHPNAWEQTAQDIFEEIPKVKVRFLYCGWAGPTLGPELLPILHENNSYDGEVAVMLGCVGSYGKTVCTVRGLGRIQWSQEPDSPHHEIDVRIEIGRVSPYGSLRLVYGRRFRDTRPIRPADQKAYWGVRYMF